MDVQVMHAAGRIAISGEMTIYAAASLKQQLFELMQSGQQPLEVDLSQVTALDTSGLQILLMLPRVAGERGHACRVVAASAAVREVLRLCGLTRLLAQADGTDA